MTVLTDQPARDRISGAVPEGLDETLFVEAGAGSGKTHSLVQRVVGLVRAGVEIRHVAAITFTEKAAAELRDRIRLELERLREADGDPRWDAALEQLDGAAIGTLHAFARRLLGERPIEAGLPPDLEVYDEVASQIAFTERWERFRGELLDTAALRRPLLLAFAAGVTLEHLRQMAVAFEANWDLLATKVPWRPEDVEPAPVDVRLFTRRLRAVCDAGDACTEAEDRMLVRLAQLREYAERLAAASDEYEALRLLGETTPSFKTGNCGNRKNWEPGTLADLRERIACLGEERARLHTGVVDACVKRLAVAVKGFVLAAAAERRAGGELEFHDLLVLARALLTGAQGVEVRRAFRARYRRLLLDEFQDTDPIQVELAVLLASDDENAATKAWWQVPVRPGALFVVGDPKQSIYRFRRADIALFLTARSALTPEALALSTNFRTTPPVIEWINHVFSRLIAADSGSQPAYQPLAPSPQRTAAPRGPGVALLGVGAHAAEPGLDADALRDREAHDVAATVVTAVAEGWQVLDRRDEGGSESWRPARLGDITILIPARTSLAALERALDGRGIAYRADASSLVYSTPEIRELFATLRAIADPTDQLSLVAALRSRVFGCGDDDLATFKLRHGGRWNLRAPLPDDLPGDHPVGQALIRLRAWHEQSTWLAPSELLDRIARDRRLFELGFADGRPRDLWRRIRFVTEQAREWSEAEGGTLRQYLAWAKLQASDSTRVAETVLPETDDDSVRIMTVHAAKGLEFPITIVSGLTTASRRPQTGLQVSWPPHGPAGFKVGTRLVTPEFEAFQPLDEQMGFHERLRLLYVACTRVRDHLVVSLHRKQRNRPPDEPYKYSNAELLAQACQDAPHQLALELAGDPVGLPRSKPATGDGELPDLATWEAELQAALARGAAPRTVAATRVGLLAGSTGDDFAAGDGEQAPAPGHDDPGLAKEPRDLDLPPWLKGRYGTGVGRAVHAVLQTVDLASGAGLDEAVAAQAAAEGVTGRERDIAALASSALASPAVRDALRHPRWRETYVAAPVGEVTLEGYVDLLYRAPDGLVVVDYKTASSTTDLDARAAGYRLQGAAYALAVAMATGEPVARCVFVFLTPDGAVEHEVADLPAAVAEVRDLLGGPRARLPGPDLDAGDPAPA